MAVHPGVQIAAAAAAPAGRGIGPALLGAALFAALVAVGDRLLGDPDSHWHVALGRLIWRDGALPWTDTLSHTFAGAPWIAKEWLSQLILFAAHAAAGWAGTVAVGAGALALTFALLFRWLDRRIRTSAALAATLIAIILVAPHFLARPHVFGLLALFGWTAGLLAAAERGRAPSAWCLALLALWANLHGSVTIAYPLAGMVALEAVLAAPAPLRRALALRWAAFGALSLAAGCLTPYGVHAMIVTATLFGSGESLPFVTEWQPIRADATGAVALGSAALLAAALAADLRRNAVRLAILAGLGALFVRHLRFLDVYAIVAPMLAAGPIARRFPALRPETAEPSPATARLARLALLALAAAAAALLAVRTPAPDPVVTPRAALDAARRAGVAGPVYNDYDFGGLLIAEGIPTFIDGRTDQLFLGGFISGLFRAVRDEADRPFLDLMDRHGVGWALVRTGSDEARHLARGPWRRIHEDPVASVLVRAETR